MGSLFAGRAGCQDGKVAGCAPPAPHGTPRVSVRALRGVDVSECVPSECMQWGPRRKTVSLRHSMRSMPLWSRTSGLTEAEVGGSRCQRVTRPGSHIVHYARDGRPSAAAVR